MEYIDEITKKVAGEIADFEKKHGYIDGGFATGLARKYAIEAYQEGLKDFEESNKRADELMDKLRFKEQYNESYNQGVRDAAESKSGINIKYKDHVSVVLTANDRDTYTSKSEEFMDFLHSVDKDLISKQSILKLLK